MISDEPLRIALIAGEHSGDILGAGLIKALKQHYPNATFEGIGGPRMLAEGFKTHFQMEELAVMGVFEVLPKLFRLLSIKKQIVQRFIDNPPDIFIGIDAPDFNLRVEKPLKAAGIKTVHYVSPSVWAWREKRVFKVAEATNLVLALLPFEKAFYDKHNIPCAFVGHTLADELPLEDEQIASRTLFDLSATDKVLAVLPGSRGSEVTLLSEPYIQAVLLLKAEIPELKVLVPLVNEKRKEEFLTGATKHNAVDIFTLVDGKSREVMTAADAVLLASGTAALECMLLKRPMVVGYKLKALTYHLVTRLFKFNIEHFSLPNLLAGKQLVPELLQNDLTPENLAATLKPLLEEDQTALKQTFYEMHKSLRLDASKQAALAVSNVIENKHD
ncbi:MAG: lipid-A-disaccharide synthase [Pseudomonadota bacterium]|uniref:lipid-A-disaccharide synthase n=1 Tax=Pseudoalteromonas TaxID=53246 RepID=UPI00026CA3EC|nr:lipid-A-disaccharide synthase [Pseudoalteromonas spongiae]ATC99103.1 lipid-A-disaccharide synthase [Pseudoalteromonas spongiae UST010723-006]MEC8324879.1 lipid-A-disaccharide synthase [Pseudomonadota bacterium]